MKMSDIINEDAGSGATGSGSVATVVGGVGGMQKRNPDGTAVNALDQDNLLGGNTKIKKKQTSKT